MHIILIMILDLYFKRKVIFFNKFNKQIQEVSFGNISFKIRIIILWLMLPLTSCIIPLEFAFEIKIWYDISENMYISYLCWNIRFCIIGNTKFLRHFSSKYKIFDIYMKCPILIFILISKNIKDIKNISNKNYHLFEMSLNKSAKLNVDYFDIKQNLYF